MNNSRGAKTVVCAAKSETTDKLAPLKAKRTGGHVGKKHLGLIRAHETVCNPSTIQRAPQPITILYMHSVEPGIATNGTKASNNSDRGFMQRGDDYVRAAYDGKAIGVRVPHAMSTVEFNRKGEITIAHGQRSEGARDDGVNAICANSIHADDEIHW